MQTGRIWSNPMNTPSAIITVSAVFNYKMELRYEPFYIPFNPLKARVKLPNVFLDDLVKSVDEKVFLCDPCGNLFEVLVERENGKFYFSKGWHEMGVYYGMEIGGWVRIVFARKDRFLVKLRNRFDQEIVYPIPPQILWLGEEPRFVACAGGDVTVNCFANIVQSPDLFHILEKTLTYADVYSGQLHIPFEFCSVAFQASGVLIMIYDEYGVQASANLMFNSSTPDLCGISGGWERFCLVKVITDGMRIQIAVPATTGNSICFRQL